MCVSCRAKSREAKRRRVEEGRCGQCGRPLDREGYKNCSRCISSNAEHYRRNGYSRKPSALEVRLGMKPCSYLPIGRSAAESTPLIDLIGGLESRPDLQLSGLLRPHGSEPLGSDPPSFARAQEKAKPRRDAHLGYRFDLQFPLKVPKSAHEGLLREFMSGPREEEGRVACFFAYRGERRWSAEATVVFSNLRWTSEGWRHCREKAPWQMEALRVWERMLVRSLSLDWTVEDKGFLVV